jgi:predicted metal-dependent peptidase
MDFKDYIKAHWDDKDLVIPSVNISSLRHFLIKKCPFYSQALQLVNTELVDTPKVPACGHTNGYKIYLNPRIYALTEKASIEAKLPWFKTPEMGFAFILMHEAGHLVFDSFGRQGGRDPRMWNTATDYQINQFVVKLLKESGVFSTPQSYQEFLHVINKNFLLDPAKYEKMNAEMTYDDLYKIRIGSGGGECPGNGSLAGDLVEPDEDDMPDQERMDREIVKSELKDYATKNASKLAGVGSCFREFSFLQEPPKVNLKMVLRQITDKEVTDDWGWHNRGSRMDHLLTGGSRLPSVVPCNPDVVRKVFFVLDSSGSMSDEQLNDALNIVKDCLGKYTRQPIYLIIHTSDIVFSQDIKSHNDVIEKYSGGTAFRPVLEEIERVRKEERIEPSVVIWLTDYYGEMRPQAEDLRKTVKNPFKQFKWIISGSQEVPDCGAYYYIDEV